MICSVCHLWDTEPHECQPLLTQLAEALRRQAQMSFWDPPPGEPGAKRIYCWCNNRPEDSHPYTIREDGTLADDPTFEHEVRCMESKRAWDRYKQEQIVNQVADEHKTTLEGLTDHEPETFEQTAKRITDKRRAMLDRLRDYDK